MSPKSQEYKPNSVQPETQTFFNAKTSFLINAAGKSKSNLFNLAEDILLHKYEKIDFDTRWTAKEYVAIEQDLRALRYLDHEESLTDAQAALLVWEYIESELLRRYYMALDPNQAEFTPRAKKQAKRSKEILDKLSLQNEPLAAGVYNHVKEIENKEKEAKEQKGFFAFFEEFFSHSSNIRTSLDTGNGIRLLLRFWSLTITAAVLAAEKISFLTTAVVNAAVLNQTFNIASVSLYAFRFTEEISVATSNIYRAYEANIDPWDQLMIELKQRGEYFLNDGPTGWGSFNWTNFEFVRKGLGINEIKVHGCALVDVLMGAYLFYDLFVITGFWWIKRQDSLEKKAKLEEESGIYQNLSTSEEGREASSEESSEASIKNHFLELLRDNQKAIFEIDIDIKRNDATRWASAKAAILLILGFSYVLSGGVLALPIGFLVCTFATHCYAMAGKDAENVTLDYIEEEQATRGIILYPSKDMSERRKKEEDKIFLTRLDNLVVAPALIVVAAVTGLWPVSLVGGVLYALYRGGVFDKSPVDELGKAPKNPLLTSTSSVHGGFYPLAM